MRAVVQRVNEASVTVAGDVVAVVEQGLLLLVGVTASDTTDDAGVLATKIADLRIFRDGAGLMNRSIVEIGGACLVVPQFTLYGSVRKGRRPSFADAARPEHAAPLIDELSARLRDLHIQVATGVFGAHMQVALVNDGPVTILVEVSEGRVV